MSGHALIVFLSVMIGSVVAVSSAGELVLAENGASAYQIVVADSASPSTKHAAEELQKYLEQMTGARLPVVSDRQPVGAKEISVGDNAHFRALKTDIDIGSLGKEGYVIRTVGDHLLLAGGSVRGALYSVYGLLEDHLGCRWFTPDCDRIPKTPRLALGAIDDRQIPALEYREPYLFACFDPEWCARNRMNSNTAALEEKHGGKMAFGDGYFVHTFARLIPPEKYFNDHPEYFSLVDGKRLKENTQLCCTNPDVMRLCAERILEEMRKQPNATVFSVSQNDCDHHCRCANCQALTDEEGSQMAPVLQLVNHVAEAVEKEFPDKVIETLAYSWTRRAPKRMQPRPNVVIRLCSIECCFSHPMATCDHKENVSFRNDLEDWARVAPRLWVWDYASDFDHYLLPFPNQRVRAPNVQYYIAHHVKGIFEQDNGDSPHTELAELGGYLTAKCLWNPNCDMNRAMNEFLEGYYGKASAPIREYIDRLHDCVEREHIHVDIRTTAVSRHLNEELLTRANELWQQAEDSVAEDPVLLNRVKIGRLSVDDAILERARLQSLPRPPANPAFMQLAQARFRPFSNLLKNCPVCLGEGQPLDKEIYCRGLFRDLELKKP